MERAVIVPGSNCIDLSQTMQTDSLDHTSSPKTTYQHDTPPCLQRHGDTPNRVRNIAVARKNTYNRSRDSPDVHECTLVQTISPMSQLRCHRRHRQLVLPWMNLFAFIDSHLFGSGYWRRARLRPLTRHPPSTSTRNHAMQELAL